MNTKLNRNRGKRAEKAIASILNGKRVGILGGEDVSHPFLSIEIKERQKFAGEKFLNQAKDNAQPGKTPIVIVHIHNQRHDEDMVMMRLQDFKELLKNVQ